MGLGACQNAPPESEPLGHHENVLPPNHHGGHKRRMRNGQESDYLPFRRLDARNPRGHCFRGTRCVVKRQRSFCKGNCFRTLVQLILYNHNKFFKYLLLQYESARMWSRCRSDQMFGEGEKKTQTTEFLLNQNLWLQNNSAKSEMKISS